MVANKKLTVDEKIQRVLEAIGNCHITVETKIRSLDRSFVEQCTYVRFLSYVRSEMLQINSPLNRTTTEYWFKRGWSKFEAKEKARSAYENTRKTKVYSPFSKEHWIQKGYSEEEAEYIRNSKRPIRKEYWLERGYSESEAIERAKEQKKSNDKAGAAKSAKRSDEEMRESSIRCIEYYLIRGYSETEAKEMVSENQATFSLEKCIEKYGMAEGILIWEDRQKKWQQTIKSKPKEEIELINQKKDSIGLKNFNSVEDCIKSLEKRNMKIYVDIDSFRLGFLEKIKIAPYIVYWPLSKILSDIPKVQKEIISPETIQETILPYLKCKERYLIQKTGKQAYRKWEEDGLLRSSFEIYFFDEFKKKFPYKQISIDNCYPNSNFRYDFLIDNTMYIEICPEYDKNETYRNKMNMKEKVFGCIILKTICDIDKFLESLV
jgi:hypothetical protein